MAINLWEAGGKLTAYNPFPSQFMFIPIKTGDYRLTFKAKSVLNGKVFIANDGGQEISKFFQLNGNFQTFSYDAQNKTQPNFLFYGDHDLKGDIIIEDIKLVEKPRAVIDYQKNLADVSVLSDKSKFTTDTAYIDYTQQLKPLTTYTASFSSVKAPPPGGWTVLNISNSIGAISTTLFNHNNSGGSLTGNVYGELARTFTTDTTGRIIWNCYDHFNGDGPQANWFTSLLTDLQLEEGTVKTSYQPYKKENKQAEVNKRTVFLKEYEYVKLDGSLNWVFHANHIGFKAVRIQSFIPNVIQYTKKVLNTSKVALLAETATDFTGANKVFEGIPSQSNIVSDLYLSISNDITGFTQEMNPTSQQWKDFFNNNNYHLLYKLKQPILVETGGRGMFPAEFKEFEYGLKSSRTGVIMDGVTNYLQLPSITMDSIEVDCLIDSSNVSSIVVDARDGLANAYLYHNGFYGSGFSKRFVDGVEGGVIQTNKRLALKVVGASAFTDTVRLFSNKAFVEKTLGVIYGIKCYLNGKVVAEYDFTKENTKANQVLFGNKTWNTKQAKR